MGKMMWTFPRVARGVLQERGVFIRVVPEEHATLHAALGRSGGLFIHNLRKLTPKFVHHVLAVLAGVDITVASDGDPAANYAMWTNGTKAPNDNSIYRVAIDVVNNHIEVVCFGMDSVDVEAEGIYRSTHELPMWIQEKVAVLSVMSAAPPTSEVAGVGRRIDETTFWVYK
jgi:hypothetical protein